MVTEKWGIDELNEEGLRKTIEERLEKGAPLEDTTKIAYAAFQYVYGACFGLQELLQCDDTITNQNWVEFLKLKNKETYAELKRLVKDETKNKIKKWKIRDGQSFLCLAENTKDKNTKN